MARTMSSPLSSLSEHTSKAADAAASESTRDQVVETIIVPIKDGGIRNPSRRSSWKFNTDWEGAISSFKSASSMLSSSLSSWYHVLDIDEEEEDHDDDGKESGMGDPNHHNRSKENSFKRPSLHSTMLKEEEARSSFAKGSFGGSLADDDDRIDSLEELHR